MTGNNAPEILGEKIKLQGLKIGESRGRKKIFFRIEPGPRTGSRSQKIFSSILNLN
ncbi:MAG: hypothetical protein OP8BY_0049 [Candidatus Saccharicenans subterraneus]|uniref:Uncharacterized protein n=1 Tax=Candidatus Saccharicenans subterraneus TaxID=2508984 RepID=A0A3E2BLV4_9BACT|nr:MAG: hypothetical protein OP8BY_0049 [Candidatus Saccharicenans subterraneum]